MAKRKVKSKVNPTKHQCTCSYNRSISNIYTEAFAVMMHEHAHEEENEYVDALLHNDEFNLMAGALQDEDCDPRMVMADAVRCGFEAGRRKLELELLEKSVGM